MLRTGVFDSNPLLPMSDATTGYDLITDAIQCIMDEPRRLYMPDWIVRGGRLRSLFVEAQRPSCGTACCLGGWITMLALGPSINEAMLNISHTALNLTVGSEDIYTRRAAAGITWEEWREARQALYHLFGDTTPDWIQDSDVPDEDGYRPGHYPEVGSVEYAEQYANKLRAFQQQHERVLRATVVDRDARVMHV